MMAVVKSVIRRDALAARRMQPEKDALSERILGRAAELPELTTAETIMIYVDVRDEVRTRKGIAKLRSQRKTVVVPWCVDELELALFRHESPDELERGRFGIDEPSPALRTLAGRVVNSAALDVAFVPGVAFDRTGGRIGYGRGYFDRLLSQTRPDTLFVGLAFECQLVEQVPMEPHDRRMDVVVTETGTYRVKLPPESVSNPKTA